MRSSLLAAALALVLALPGAARADVDAASKAAAEALFKEGRRLMSEEKYALGCPKLAESQRLDPAAGTLLNLADCFEKSGQTASAWVTFTEAARAADARHRSDWKALAEEHVRALEPNLSTLAIEVDPATSTLDPTVTRDGASVGRAQWTTAIPTDPGPHVVEVTAKGYEPFRARVVVGKLRDHATVRVPALRTPVTVATSSGGDGTSLRAPAGITLLSAGGALVGAGVVFGVLSSSRKSTVDSLCPSSPCADRRGLDANDQAHTFATLSTIGFVAGAALAAGGLVVLLWPSRSGGTDARVVISPTGAAYSASF